MSWSRPWNRNSPRLRLRNRAIVLHVVLALTLAAACGDAGDPSAGADDDALPGSDVADCAEQPCERAGPAAMGPPTIGPPEMPDEANTGVPAGTRLRRLPDDDYFTLETDGEVIDGAEIDGCLVVLANDVVVRNSLIRCPGPNAAIWQREGEGGLFERNTIEGTGMASAGVAGSHMVVRGNRITGTVDGIKIGPDTIVEGNWISSLREGEVNGDQAHNDGIQSQGGSAVLIFGNRIEGPRVWWANGGVFLKQESGSAPIHDAVVASNWFSGFGYTVRCMFDANCTIVNNVFEEESMLWGPFRLEEGAVGRVACNTWTDGSTLDGQDASECPFELSASDPRVP